MKIFISHSHQDKQIAKAIVDYLLSALTINDEDIRCTSVPGHQLNFGKSIAELLKNDLNITLALITLITEQSLQSKWVMFELGAAWGLGTNIFPILDPSLKIEDLPGPLVNLQCIEIKNSDASSRMSDLVKQLSTDLKIVQKHGGKPQANLNAFLELFKEKANKENKNDDNKRQFSQKDLILITLWRMDELEYSEYGYSIETISIKSEIKIPMCKHILDSITKEDYIDRKNYMGAINGDRYKLTDSGRRYLIKENLVS